MQGERARVYQSAGLPAAVRSMSQLVELQTFQAGAHSLDFPGGSCVAPESIFQLELQLHSLYDLRTLLVPL